MSEQLKQKTILFFYNHITTFVQKDIELLNERFEVKTHDFYSPKKILTPLSFVRQKLFLLVNIWTCDVVLCQFAGYHSLLPVLFAKILGKRSLIVVGGTDAHNFPGIGYGNFQKRFLSSFTKWSFKRCSEIVPKHKSLMQSDYSYDENEPKQQGIYPNVDCLQTPFTEIANGYDAAVWNCSVPKKKRSFITVSGGWGFPFQMQLKGIDLILRVAALFPDCEFAIAGVTHPSLFTEAPHNVKILPTISNDKLSILLSEYEFYMQLSMAEGFPNALCEAMLCACVPVGSDVFSIPEIIGDSGFVLKHRNVEELKHLVALALSSNTTELGKKARARIQENYSLEERKRKLISVCEA